MFLLATREPGAACRTDQFMCQRGDQCVPSSYQCDGEMDCQDRSDEIGCGKCQTYFIVHLAVSSIGRVKYY